MTDLEKRAEEFAIAHEDRIVDQLREYAGVRSDGFRAHVFDMLRWAYTEGASSETERWRKIAYSEIKRESAICDMPMLELLVVAAYRHDEISIGRALELLPHRDRDWIRVDGLPKVKEDK